MEKTILVKGHYRNGKYIPPYRYVRTFKEPSFKRGKIGKSYVDDLSRKVIALRKYSDFQSPDYQEVMDYLKKHHSKVAHLIGSRSKMRFKITKNTSKDIWDNVNYAYNILYTE